MQMSVGLCTGKKERNIYNNLSMLQVVTGGHYDVDVVLQDPTRKVLYKQIKKQYDSFTWTAEKTGEYVACFSNEFSTFSHKLVYIDFQVTSDNNNYSVE